LATQEIKVPNIGDATNVEVIEILVSKGTQVKKDDSLITLESDKASMEIPSPTAGTVESIQVKIGDRISEGSVILKLAAGEVQKPAAEEPKNKVETPAVAAQPAKASATPKQVVEQQPVASVTSSEVHAGPAVRRIAREFGVDLSQISGSGDKNRILKEDLQKYVKSALSQGPGQSGFQLPTMPEIDFSKYGEIEQVPLNKIKKLTGVNLHRSWITVPHVTQFGEADITDLEEFRKSQKAKLDKEGLKLTPLVFIMKAVIAALKNLSSKNTII
jgi:pyruvate dehydrogenase E2 component (dihydrolipoamide acetyltransferase)